MIQYVVLWRSAQCPLTKETDMAKFQFPEYMTAHTDDPEADDPEPGGGLGMKADAIGYVIKAGSTSGEITFSSPTHPINPSAAGWSNEIDGGLAETKKRRPKGRLEKQVREVCDGYVTGDIDFDEQPVTAHRVAKVIAESDHDHAPPSAGSVAAVFVRWEEIGAAVLDTNPDQFIGYTLEASELGFKELYDRHNAQ